MTKLVKKAVDTLVKNVKDSNVGMNEGGTGSDNCRHGYLDKDGDGNQYQHPCHAHVAYIKQPVVYWNRYCRRPTEKIPEELNRVYFDWITGEDSPWKSFRGKSISHTPFSLEQEDDSQEARNWIYENGWVWSDLSHPVNFQHSFLVATRMAAEWPEYIKIWNRWVTSLGSEKYRSLAFVFLTMFTQLKADSTKYVISYHNKYDWPIDTGTCDEIYVRNFIDGTPVGPWGSPFSESSQYTPVNSIWGNSFALKKDTYTYSVFDRYKSSHGPIEKECRDYWTADKIGMASFNYEDKWWVSELELLDIIRCEYARLHETSIEKVA